MEHIKFQLTQPIVLFSIGIAGIETLKQKSLSVNLSKLVSIFLTPESRLLQLSPK